MDYVSFGVHNLHRPVHYYKIGVRVCVLHNAACYILLSLLLKNVCYKIRVRVDDNAALLDPYFIIVDWSG